MYNSADNAIEVMGAIQAELTALEARGDAASFGGDLDDVIIGLPTADCRLPTADATATRSEVIGEAGIIPDGDRADIPTRNNNPSALNTDVLVFSAMQPGGLDTTAAATPTGDPFVFRKCPNVRAMHADPLLRKSALVVVSFVALLWGIRLFEWLTGWPLVTLGLYPRSLTGLSGILFAPLIHGSLAHIAANSFGVLILGIALLYGYPKSRWWVLGTIWVLSGVGVWLFARPSFHVGASGLTHGLFFFLLAVSMLRRDRRSIALMMMASMLFGGMFWGILPSEEGISFEYHLFGGIAGVIAAIIFRRWDPMPVEKRYDWEDEEESDSR